MPAKKTKEAKPKEEEKSVVSVSNELIIPKDIDLGQAYEEQKEIEEIGLKDFSMPFIKMCQGLSEEKDSGHEKYIPGIVEGDIFNSVTREVVECSPEREESTDGVIVVPAFVQPTYVEWVPRGKGGGFVEDHGLAKGTELAREIKTANRKDETTGHPLLPNGNELMETTYWFCLLIEPELIQQVLIAFQSTGLSKSSRPWQTVCDNMRGPNGERVHRAYGAFQLLPKLARNAKGRWYVFRAAPLKVEGKVVRTLQLENGPEIYKSAIQFGKDIKSLLDEGITVVPEEDSNAPEAAPEVYTTDAPTPDDLNADKDNY